MTTIAEFKKDKIEAERKIAEIMSEIKDKHGVRVQVRSYWDYEDHTAHDGQDYFYFPIVKIESDL